MFKNLMRMNSVPTYATEAALTSTAANLRAELDAQQKQSEVLVGEIAEMREEVKSRSDVQELRQEVQLLRQELADVKQDLHVLRQDFTASQQAKRTTARKKVPNVGE